MLRSSTQFLQDNSSGMFIIILPISEGQGTDPCPSFILNYKSLSHFLPDFVYDHPIRHQMNTPDIVSQIFKLSIAIQYFNILLPIKAKPTVTNTPATNVYGLNFPTPSVITGAKPTRTNPAKVNWDKV